MVSNSSTVFIHQLQAWIRQPGKEREAEETNAESLERLRCYGVQAVTHAVGQFQAALHIPDHCRLDRYYSTGNDPPQDH